MGAIDDIVHEAESTITIIGAGFSGTMTAVHLLRNTLAPRVRVVLVSRTEQMGQGLAYGTSSESHVLNVPAGQMSAYAGEPDHFLRWLHQISPNAKPGDFVRRYLYGRYVEDQLSNAEQQTTCLFERKVGKAVDILPAPDGRSATLQFADGETLRTDQIVLAVGNFPPVNFPVRGESFYETPRYVRNPWSKGWLDLIKEGDAVLLLGTGLTMVDIATELYRHGVRQILAISRRGLVPRSHRYPSRPPLPGLLPPGMIDQAHTVREYLRHIRNQIDHCRASGIDWRDVVASLRPHTNQIWAGLNRGEKSRFLRHLKAYWEVHRHRMAPEQSFVIDRLIADGVLTALAGRVLAYEQTDEGVTAQVRLKGSRETTSLRVSCVVNCTGPGTDVRSMDDPLIAALVRRRLIHPDPLGLGVLADESGCLQDVDGKLSPLLYHVGPLLKGVLWECTAVPELRVQTERLASLILKRAAESSRVSESLSS